MVIAANWLNHLEFDRSSPVFRHWWEELSREHQVIRYDQRGCGLSDWDTSDLSFEAAVGDLESLISALGIDRCALLGASQGWSVAIEYAARHPDKVSHLALYGACSYGWAYQSEAHRQEWERLLGLTKDGWGQEHPDYQRAFIDKFKPEATADQKFCLMRLQEASTSPENAEKIQAEWGKVDLRQRLRQIAVPTLVFHARGDNAVLFEEGCRIAGLVPGAGFVLLEGKNHLLTHDEPAWQSLVSEIRQFLTSDSGNNPAHEDIAAAVELERPDLRQATAPDGTVTILFSDIEDSTGMTERLGDRRMQEVLRLHNDIVREHLAASGGFEVKSMGDGFMLAFSSACRALQCAVAIQTALAAYNEEQDNEQLRVRMGIHTGEALRESDDFYGKHVILAARVAGQAQGGQILVSSLFKALTDSAGDIVFGEEQEVELKGLTGLNSVYPVEWR